MQGFCLASGLTISIPKTEVVVFGGGHHACAWAVAGQQLQRSQSFTHLGMLFHEDRHIKHAVQHRHAKALGSLGSIFSRYRDLKCANSVQLLIRLQQAILQPSAFHACEVWAPAAAVAGPLKELQQLQHSFLRRACRVGKNVQAEVMFQELRLVRWHDFWWRRVLQSWTALATAGCTSIRNHVFRDSLALAARGCSYNWAAQVSACLQQHGVHVPIVKGDPFAIGSFELQRAFVHERQAHLQSLPLDPRTAPSAGVRLCTCHWWFSRPEGKSSVTYWDVPISNRRLHRIFRFRMGAHHLPIQMGRNLRQSRSRRVCHMCRSGALCDERHILLECPALGDLRSQYAPLIAESSGVMAQLVWADDQPLVSKYIIACLDRSEVH